MKNINNEINNKVEYSLDFDKMCPRINLSVPNDFIFNFYNTPLYSYSTLIRSHCIPVLYTDFIKKHIHIYSNFIIKITNKLNTNEHIEFIGLYEGKHKNIKIAAGIIFNMYYKITNTSRRKITDTSRRKIKKDIIDMFIKENNHDKQIAKFILLSDWRF